jgi:hypothetical protein
VNDFDFVFSGKQAKTYKLCYRKLLLRELEKIGSFRLKNFCVLADVRRSYIKLKVIFEIMQNLMDLLGATSHV